MHCSSSFSTSPLKVLDTSVVGIPTENYKETQFHGLSAEKFENIKLMLMLMLMLMYNQFIPPERRPDYLPPFVPSVANTSSRSSCSTASHDPSVHVRPQQSDHGNRAHVQCLAAMGLDIRTGHAGMVVILPKQNVP